MKVLEGYMHGINLGGWLSQCEHTKKHYDTFITEQDLDVIKSYGLDHVRVPIDYDLVEDEAGNYKEDGFVYIDNVIAWCGTRGLNMILDLHKTFGFSFDSGEGEEGFFENEAYQERFYKLWEELAKRYGTYEDRICLELLNEVTDKAYCDTWNRIAKECIRRIRVIAPTIKILVGGYYNNSIAALKDLDPPYDENIVYNFHCYEPLVFTHQGAYWVDGMNTSFRMPFASTYEEYERFTKENTNQFVEGMDRYDPKAPMGIEYFENMVKEAVRVATERNVALYCGEFGVIDLVDPKEALDWFKMICKCYDAHGIGRAVWSYKQMDFGISDPRMDEVREEILKLI